MITERVRLNKKIIESIPGIIVAEKRGTYTIYTIPIKALSTHITDISINAMGKDEYSIGFIIMKAYLPCRTIQYLDELEDFYSGVTGGKL